MIIQYNDPYTEPSFSLTNRLARLLWGVVYTIAFRPTPRLMHGWRNLLLRLFGAQIGQHVHIYPTVKIWAPWNLIAGNYVGVGEGANLYSMDQIVLGDYAVISQGAHLCAGSHDFNSANFQLITAPIHIGARVWVCAEAFIGMGVTISTGVVVGARSMVSKSIQDDWSVWGGVPAVKISMRDRSTVMMSEEQHA